MDITSTETGAEATPPSVELTGKQATPPYVGSSSTEATCLGLFVNVMFETESLNTSKILLDFMLEVSFTVIYINLIDYSKKFPPENFLICV